MVHMRNQSAFALLMQNFPTQLCRGNNPFAFPSDSCTKHMAAFVKDKQQRFTNSLKNPKLKQNQLKHFSVMPLLRWLKNSQGLGQI